MQPGSAGVGALAKDSHEVAAAVHPFGVGIDCHSKFVAVCVYALVGGEVRRWEREFPTSTPGLNDAREWAKLCIAAAVPDPGPFRYVLESTGCYHFPVVHAFGGIPSIVNPMLAGPYRRKTDKLDARTLAYHGMTGLWPASFFPRGDVIEFRVHVLRRRQRMRERTRLTHQINNALLRWGHTIASTGSVTSTFIRPVIEDMCNGVDVSHHHHISPLGLPDAVRRDILWHFSEIDRQSEKIRELEGTIRACADRMKWEFGQGVVSGAEALSLLATVPGVGFVTAFTWLAEVVSANRFASVNQLSAFVGCDPSLKVSAGKVTAHTRRKGNANMHNALIQAAQMLVSSRREQFGQWGYALSCKHGKGGWQKACGAVARRIGSALYWVQKKGVPFSYAGYRLVADAARVPETPIAALGFSPRVARLLETNGVHDARGIIVAMQGGLLKRRGFGAVARKEIATWAEKVRLRQPSGASPLPVESSHGPSGRSPQTTTGRHGVVSPTGFSPGSKFSSSTIGARASQCRSGARSTGSKFGRERIRAAMAKHRCVPPSLTTTSPPPPREAQGNDGSTGTTGGCTRNVGVGDERTGNHPSDGACEGDRPADPVRRRPRQVL